MIKEVSLPSNCRGFFCRSESVDRKFNRDVILVDENQSVSHKLYTLYHEFSHRLTKDDDKTHLEAVKHLMPDWHLDSVRTHHPYASIGYLCKTFRIPKKYKRYVKLRLALREPDRLETRVLMIRIDGNIMRRVTRYSEGDLVYEDISGWRTAEYYHIKPLMVRLYMNNKVVQGLFQLLGLDKLFEKYNRRILQDAMILRCATSEVQGRLVSERIFTKPRVPPNKAFDYFFLGPNHRRRW